MERRLKQGRDQLRRSGNQEVGRNMEQLEDLMSGTEIEKNPQTVIKRKEHKRLR